MLKFVRAATALMAPAMYIAEPSVSHAQIFDRLFQNPTAAPAPQSQPAPLPGGTREWSGEAWCVGPSSDDR